MDLDNLGEKKENPELDAISKSFSTFDVFSTPTETTEKGSTFVQISETFNDFDAFSKKPKETVQETNEVEEEINHSVLARDELLKNMFELDW